MPYNYSATQNNGRITGSVDAMTGESTTYSYDALNRLTAASNSLWSQGYSYDGFGNLTAKTGVNPMNTTYDVYNHQSGISYDANGNQLGCGFGCSNTYNVENRLVWQTTSTTTNLYAYDPFGKRVMSGSDPSPYISPQPVYTYSFYSINGQRLATLKCDGTNYPAYANCTITGQNVYFGLKLIVSGGVHVLTDRLGSVRANAQGETFAYYPYGEERTSTVDGRDKFGTYFRDSLGQDYADQRYYTASAGRFSTADPYRASVGPTDPGSWNRYSYVKGDPVNWYDPLGRDSWDPDTNTVNGDPGDGEDCASQKDPQPGCVSTGGGGNGQPQQKAGGDGGGGKSKAEIAKEVIAAGTLAAKKLLDPNNPDCAGLFGLNGSPSATEVLSKLLGADPSVGMIIVNDVTPTPGTTTSATAVGYNGHNVPVGDDGTMQLIYGFVQVTINDLAGSFVNGNTQDQAITLLHELGHVFSDLYGPNSTRIGPDSQTDTAASMANTDLVKTNSFK